MMTSHISYLIHLSTYLRRQAKNGNGVLLGVFVAGRMGVLHLHAFEMYLTFILIQFGNPFHDDIYPFF